MKFIKYFLKILISRHHERLERLSTFQEALLYRRRFCSSVLQCSKLFLESLITGCSLSIVFLPLNVLIFPNSASSAAALVFYLPGVCTHTDTEGKQNI